MAPRAPGQNVSKEEPSCFNCGLKGHFAIACPEEVRKEPAGLQAFRQRKAAAQSKGSTRGKGTSAAMVITRYAPPPSVPGTSAASYAPAPSLPPPPPYGSSYYSSQHNRHHHHPSHPPPQAPPPHIPAPGPAQSAGPPIWQSSLASYVPTYPASLPPPPPPSSYSHPAYDTYGPHPYAPLPPAHHVATPYYPPPAPPQSYGVPPVPPPQPQQPYYPSAQPTHGSSAFLPLGHPHQPAHAPPYPPAPHIPPPPLHGYPFAAPPLQYDAPHQFHAPYLDDGIRRKPVNRSRPGAPLLSRGGGAGNRDRHRERDRYKRRDRERGPHPKHQRKATIIRKPPVPPKPTEKSSPRPDREANASGANSPAPTAPAEVISPHHAEKGKSPDVEDILECEIELVFKEHPAKPAEPVGQPLPTVYSDTPMIPPAFDAKCVKSEFFSGDDCDLFVRSIRDSTLWKHVKKDPAYKAWPGMVIRRFFRSIHGYPSYRTGMRPSPDEILSEEVSMDVNAAAMELAKDRGLAIPTPRVLDLKSDAPGKRSRGTADEADFNDDQHFSKRPKGTSDHLHPPGALSSSFDGKRPLESSERGRHASEERHHLESKSRETREYGSPSRGSPRSKDSPYNPRARHDSGYHSNNSPDSKENDDRFNGGSNPARGYQARSRSQSRSRSRERGRQIHSRGFNRPNRSQHGRDGSTSRERTRSSSPLDDFEREILGMAAPKKKPAKSKRRHDKVAEAFSRRW